MDKLKKYLEQHEREMNIDVPGDAVWHRIEAHVPASSGRNRTILLIKRFAVAACVAGITVACGWWLITRDNKEAVEAGKIVSKDYPAKKDSVVGRDTSDLDHHEMALAKPLRLYSSKRPVHGPLKSAEPVQAELPMTETVSAISDGYNRMINYQLNKLRSTAIHAESPAYFSLFTTQLRKMEKDEQNLRADIHKYGVTNELLEQLINLYQQKLNVLKRLQVEINKMNNKVNENQRPSQKGSKYYLNI